MEIISLRKQKSYSFVNLFGNKLEEKNYNQKVYINYNNNIKRLKDFDDKKFLKKENENEHVIYEKIIKLHKMKNKKILSLNKRNSTPNLLKNSIYHKKIIKNTLNVNVNKSMIENNNNLLSTNITNNIFILEKKQNKKKEDFNSQRLNNNKNNYIQTFKLDYSLSDKKTNKKEKIPNLKNYCNFNYQRKKSNLNNIEKINDTFKLNYSITLNKKHRDFNFIPIKSKYLEYNVN